MLYSCKTRVGRRLSRINSLAHACYIAQPTLCKSKWPASLKPAGHSVDCCGFTKRWSRLRVPRKGLWCGHFGELRVLVTAISGATYAGPQSYSPVELRSTQSDRSKSQPPHLVYRYINYCQNLSSDHLLSGVVTE